jgi:hypothetical protein
MRLKAVLQFVSPLAGAPAPMITEDERKIRIAMRKKLEVIVSSIS